MKIFIRITTILLFVTAASLGKAQTMNICAGTYTWVNAINSSGLTSPTYSLNPGGITSSSNIFSVSPGSTTTYTLYTTGTNGSSAIVTISNTITVQVQSPPTIGSITISQNPLTCANPTTLVQAAPNSSVQYNWLPSGTQGNSLVVASNTAASTQSIASVHTLVVTGNNNGCQSTTVIPVYQNRYAPTASINGGNPSSCTSTIMLNNFSSSGIPSPFPVTAPVVALLWQGPAPQPTLSMSTSYIAQTPGVYTLTAMDMNNGCTNTATYNVAVGQNPTAAFVHTITSGQAIFNDVSTGTSTGVNYFWNFGDGNTSTQQNPTHTYLSGGSYLVKFKVTNSAPGSLCTDSVIQSVAVSGVPCVANSNFSMTPTNTAQVWNATPASPWNVIAASWDWGDGSGSSILYTSHQYSAAGLYNICLTVIVSCMATSSTCTSYSVYRASQSALIVAVHVMAPELITGLGASQAADPFSWNIIPNPNEGAFNLHMSSTPSEPVLVVISDLTGRIVHHQFVDTASTVPIHTSNLPPGMYLVSVETDNHRVTKRMVVYH